MLKRLFKIFLYALAGLVILLVSMGGLTQTRRFKNWLRHEIMRQATAAINGTLRLGRIEGNLISRFDFHDLCIELEGDTLLYVPSIEAGLSPVALLKHQILIDHLVLRAPALSLRQRPDSAWNVAQVMKPVSPTAEPETASPWRVAMQNLRVENGAINFLPLDTSYKLLPRRIQKISTAIRLEYDHNHLNLILRHLQFKALHPNFALHSLAAQIFWGGDSLLVKGLKLRSDNSELAGQITVRHLARPVFEVELQGTPLHLNDLQAFVPLLPVAGPMNASIYAIGDMQNMRATFHLAHADGLADGSVLVLQDSTAVYYHLEVGVRGLNLNPYLPHATGKTRLNFDFKLDGSGLMLDDLNAKLALSLDSSRVFGRELAQLRLAAQARGQQIQAEISARSSAGELQLTGKLIDPQRRQIFELDAEGRDFDLATLLQNDTLASDISFRLAGSGHNFDPSQLKFDGWLRLFPSRLPAVLIDSAYCRFHSAGTDLQLDTLHVASSMGTVQADGLMSLRYENNFRFRAELGDLAWVKRAMEADTLRAAGVITGHARGPFDSLAVAGRFEMRQIQYNLTAIKKLAGNLTFNRLPDPAKRGGLIQMQSSGLMAGYLPLDSATAVVHFDLERAQIESKFWQGVNNYGELNGLYTFGEAGRFEVWRGMIKAFGQTWQTPADSTMSVEVGDEVYDFHRLSLASGNQRLDVDGRLSYLGAEDLRFKIEGVEIASLAALMGNETAAAAKGVAGTLALQGHLTGSADAPILHGQAQWSNGRVSDFAFEKWEGEFGYEDEKFFWQFALQQNQDRRLTGEGYLPMNLSLNNDGAVLYRDRPIRIQAATTNIDLAFLETFTSSVKQVQGRLALDITLGNTLRQPRSKGAMRILNGALALPRYGVAYKDLQLTASIDSSFVKVVELKVQSDKGVLTAKGQLNFTQDAITDANGSLTASDFLVARNRDMELRIDAKIVGTGNREGAEYSGGINVKRSRFFLRNLQQSSVIELDESTMPKKSPADSAAAAASPANPMQRWLDNLNGELKINIPRNTWIRGPEFNAEIEGALDFIQEGMDDFSLFGPLNIIRGTYELLGKRFDIDGGQITFLGDYQTPQLDLTARHSFRGGDREKKTLEVKISGSLAEPQIQFLRDGEPVDERDALANLFFGLDFEQLLSGQREDVQEEASKVKDLSISAAGGLLSGLVSQQLEKSFGRSLNLDLIQFEGGDNISVVVGKYLTNDVFISLSQEPEARVFSLEWELYKFFFLLLQGAQGEDANKKTGIDFIWKKDW